MAFHSHLAARTIPGYAVAPHWCLLCCDMNARTAEAPAAAAATSPATTLYSAAPWVRRARAPSGSATASPGAGTTPRKAAVRCRVHTRCSGVVRSSTMPASPSPGTTAGADADGAVGPGAASRTPQQWAAKVYLAWCGRVESRRGRVW